MSPERWQRIESLYYDALERPPHERGAWLAQACKDDAELQHEVEALLAANDEASGFLKTQAMHLAAHSLASEQPTRPLSAAAGQRLSHYQVLSRIGAGGMGEVYLARDTSLERHVALKLLPVNFTQDPERLQRFVREAKAASALNHPNIITIYEIGVVSDEGRETHFIATEYIEGVTLRAWKPDEDQRLNQTIELGIQIASALDAAHQAGIVHRDIKPENLMVRPDGLVKVLDFGLAKLATTHNSGNNQVDTGAQTTPAEMHTTPGTILGTLRYMSPEQARGRALDGRTDIFSLGVVLYELLTRQPLFEGESSADVIAAILHKEPAPLHNYLPEAPAELERILRKALAKDSRDRYQNVADLQIDLRTLKQDAELSARLARSGHSGHLSGAQLLNSSASVSGNHVQPAAVKRWRWLLAAAVIALAGLAAGVWQSWRAATPVVPRDVQFKQLFARKGQDSVLLMQARFSPDGKMIAYSATGSASEGPNIWVKQVIGSRENQLTTGPWRESSPVWSPDGNQIAFISNRSQQLGIWTIPFTGDAPRLLTELTRETGTPTGLWPRLLAWTKTRPTLYYEWNRKLYEFNLTAQTITQLPALDPALQNPEGFALAPSETEFALTAEQGGRYDLWRVAVSGGAARRVTNDSELDQYPLWYDDDRLLYNSQREGKLQVRLSAASGGGSVSLPMSDHSCFLADAVTVAGKGPQLLCYEDRDESDVYAVTLNDGELRQITNALGAEFWAQAAAPEQGRLLYQALGGERFFSDLQRSSLFLKDLKSDAASSSSVQLEAVQLAEDTFDAQWSPNGQQVAFLRSAAEQHSLLVVNASGGLARPLVAQGVLFGGQRNSPPYNRVQPKSWSWSPDSQRIAYCTGQTDAVNVWTVPVSGGQPTQLSTNTDAEARLGSPLWSPDGKSVAYVAETIANSANGKETWQVWATNSVAPQLVFSTESVLRLLGWTGNNELLVALADNVRGSRSRPTNIRLVRVSLTTAAAPQPVGELIETYLSNVHLAADGEQLAFVQSLKGKDDIWVGALSTGRLSRLRKLTNNPEQYFYYASLSWATDAKTIYFDRQTRWSLLTMLELNAPE